MTQLSYNFENWDGMRPREPGHRDQVLIITDCVRFQEILLCSKLIFLGGMAEAKSKGRGEECISQNLRILCGHNGKRVILFFANSQRREHKRYVSIPRKYSYRSRMGPARATWLTGQSTALEESNRRKSLGVQSHWS